MTREAAADSPTPPADGAHRGRLARQLPSIGAVPRSIRSRRHVAGTLEGCGHAAAHPAVDGQGMTVDVRREVRDQEQDRAGDLRRKLARLRGMPASTDDHAPLLPSERSDPHTGFCGRRVIRPCGMG